MESLQASQSSAKRPDYRATGKVVYDEFDQKPSKPIVDEDRPGASGALRLHGRGAGLHHQLRHQVPDGAEGLKVYMFIEITIEQISTII